MEGKGPLFEQSHIEDKTKILKEGEKMSLYNPCGKVIRVELLRLPRSLKSYSFVGVGDLMATVQAFLSCLIAIQHLLHFFIPY